MSRKLAVLLLMVICWTTSNGQVSYLNRSDLLDQVDSCLKHTYNFSFSKARFYQENLIRITPNHPAPYFLKALIIYWENFPLLPTDKASERFIMLMNRTVELAKVYLESDKAHLEGVFFDLYGRAFKAMFWADNGKSGKVVPDLTTMYKHTKEGFILMEQFNEFYFSTGLYNYYIEAYPKAHPVYKPLVSFMQAGDKTMGLNQLNHAMNNAVFLKVESMLFMSLIQLKYEEDLNTAAIYAEKLYKEFPHNIFYQGHLLTILLYKNRFQRVREILETMKTQEDKYSDMIRVMAGAFLAEKENQNYRLAEKGYKKTVDMADSFGPFANQFKAIGYMGSSRLFNHKGNHSEANKYARKASKYTVYSFILDE